MAKIIDYFTNLRLRLHFVAMSITIKQASKILNKKAKELTDVEVQKMLESMYSMANLLVEKKLETIKK